MLNTDDVCSLRHLEWGAGRRQMCIKGAPSPSRGRQGTTRPPGARTCGLCLEQGGGGAERKPKTNWV